MKQWKRVMAVVLSFAVILTSFYVSPNLAKAAAAIQFYAEDVTAKPGEEIEVPVKIKGNTGIAGFEIDVHYDKEILTPIDDVKKSDLLKGNFDNGVKVALDNNADSFNVLWADTDNMTEDGVVFTLKFLVSAQASGSTSISLTVKDEERVYDEDLVNVPVECQPVTVNIDSDQPDNPTQPPEEPSLPPAETATIQFYAEDVTAKPGEEIEVPVKIKGNTGIAGFEIDVHYDKEILTPIDDVKKSDLLKGNFDNGVKGALDNNADSFNVLWADTDNMTEDGVVFTLKFQVSAQASGSTSISLTVKDEERVYDEDLVNVPVECQPVTVNIDSDQPDNPTQPPEEPSLPPAETEDPDIPPVVTDEPTVTSEPSEVETADIYLEYWSDFDCTQEINGYGQADYTVVVNGNGAYQVSFVATAATDNIYRLCLMTYLDPEDLPAGMKIVPTTLQVGEKTYTIGKCEEDYEFGYQVSIRDLLYERDSIEGDVPVAVGDTVTLKFRIEGIGESGTSTTPSNPPAPKATETAAVQNTDQPTETAAVQNTGQPAATKAAATKKPSRTTEPKTTSKPPKLKKPKKVNLKKVKALGKGKVRVSWKWSAAQDGYQLQYAQNRSFTKKKKTKKKSAYTNTVTLKKLKKGKTYYFRVRAFNKSGGRKKYGKWSNVKKCKIK